MTTEVFLKRPNSSVAWGFRIIGGSDSHLPIIVSKVIENSVAEKSGLEEDVLLERINNIPTSGLSHAEVNDVILAAGDEILFTVKREKLENLIWASINEENNTEITNILREAVTKGKISEEEEILAEEGEHYSTEQLKKEFEKIMIINDKGEYEESITSKQLQYNETSAIQGRVTGKRWSTFLQKPKNVAPKPKSEAPPIPKSERYRVIITKQNKKVDKVPKFEEVNETAITTDAPEKIGIGVEHEAQTLIEIHSENETEHEESIRLTEEIEDYEKRISEGMEVINQGIDYLEREIEQMVETDHSTEEPAHTEELDGAGDAAAENINQSQIEPSIVENALSLEEQLAEVQKQLQQLSQLPSEIQETLSIVTQQLANIVGEKKPQIEEEELQEPIEIESKVEEDILENESSDQGENAAEMEGDDNENAVQEHSQSDVLSDIFEEQEVTEDVDEPLGPTDEELEEIRVLEEKNAKQELENQQKLEEEANKKKWAVRPIILPGGRKWVDPDDAVVKVKNPKMSDDKICNTLETFSEVIVGKTKGINFLKYTPPPKNLEYLQRSEVYRLVHGMEPPVKGISIRSEKILAEEDYYSGKDD